jgi:dTDP-4-dehydrorhamnose 3,5-epimerase
MPFIETGFPDLKIFEPSFLVTIVVILWNHIMKNFCGWNIDIRFIQDNQARSMYGVVRGLHFQNDPHARPN